MMLMSALAAGRGISLPSQSAAACAMAAHTTGAYARIRTAVQPADRLFERRAGTDGPASPPMPTRSTPRAG